MTGYQFDYIFDWTILKYQQSQKNNTKSRLSVSKGSAQSILHCSVSFLSMPFSYFNDFDNIGYLLQPVPDGSNTRAIPTDVDIHNQG